MKRVVGGLAVIGCTLLAAAPVGAQARWTVDAKPVVDIAGTTAGGDVAFGSANWATRLASGTIVVADAATPALQFFDAKGQRIRTVGRMGQGPGEFLTLAWVGQCAKDSLFAWDWPQRRMTVFDANGTVGRSFMPSGESDAFTAACNRSGTIALFGLGRMSPDRKMTVVSPPGASYSFRSIFSSLSLGDAKGTAIGKIDDLPSGEIFAAMGGGGPRPLGKTTSFAISESSVFVAIGDSASVGVYTFDGRPAASLRLQIAPRATTRVHYERATDVALRMYPAQARDRARKQFLDAEMPEKLPPINGLLTDPDGLLWVVLTVPGDADTQLRAVRATGQVVADVRVPVNLVVFEIGADYILGVREDADGEQHVVLYRLRRGR